MAQLAAAGDVTWAPSRPSAGIPEPRPLFFYHVPKTGGLSFYLAMAHAFSRGWPPGRARRSVGRFDDPLETFEERPGRPSTLPPDAIFAATHHGFGFHERLGQDFALATIVRDPVHRVTSAYTYECMRSDKAPTAHEFEAFIRRPDNVDVIPNQLLGAARPSDTDTAIAAVIELLETKFDAFVTSELVTPLLTAYLAIFGLPNVLLENLNRTLPRYRIDPKPWADEIRARNAVGWSIYRYVAANPRLPKAPQSDKLHPKTVVIRLRERRARTMEESLVFETGELMRGLQANPEFWRVPPEGE